MLPDCTVLVRTASISKKIKKLKLKIGIFTVVKNCCMLHVHVFIMFHTCQLLSSGRPPEILKLTVFTNSLKLLGFPVYYGHF